jgi:hypothetical protein
VITTLCDDWMPSFSRIQLRILTNHNLQPPILGTVRPSAITSSYTEYTLLLYTPDYSIEHNTLTVGPSKLQVFRQIDVFQRRLHKSSVRTVLIGSENTQTFIIETSASYHSQTLGRLGSRSSRRHYSIFRGHRIQIQSRRCLPAQCAVVESHLVMIETAVAVSLTRTVPVRLSLPCVCGHDTRA